MHRYLHIGMRLQVSCGEIRVVPRMILRPDVGEKDFFICKQNRFDTKGKGDYNGSDHRDPAAGA